MKHQQGISANDGVNRNASDRNAESHGHDWFLPAIHAVGSVGDCLDQVLEELDQRGVFLRAVREKLVKSGNHQDNLTFLGQRAKALENTLKVRLGILNPEREASWFRISPSQTSGPFSSALLSESVFFPYNSAEWAGVRERILTCWKSSQVYAPTAGESRQCLWSMLLTLNKEFGELARLSNQFAGLSLAELPNGLPEILESRSLRAFLLNVRNEFYAVRKRLDSAYETLLAASEKFWAAQEKNALNARTEIRNDQAEDMREEFKRRRQQTRNAGIRKGDIQRQESLKFMGFEEDPSDAELRRRYLEMAKAMHPDRQGGDESAFKMLTVAYGRLSGRTMGR
jgi:hypothetical protein